MLFVCRFLIKYEVGGTAPINCINSAEYTLTAARERESERERERES